MPTCENCGKKVKKVYYRLETPSSGDPVAYCPACVELAKMSSVDEDAGEWDRQLDVEDLDQS